MLDSEIKPGGFDRLWAERRAIEGMGKKWCQTLKVENP
jgi:hypothetical protein